MAWREGFDRLPPLGPGTIELSPDTTALVVIDMQYVDAHRGFGFGRWLVDDYPEFGNYYCARIESTVVPNVQRLLTLFRDRGMRVIHLTFGPLLPDGSDYSGIDVDHLSEADAQANKRVFHQGTHEHAILPELAPLPGELVVNKTSRGAFNSTTLELALRNMGVQSLVLTGVATSVCVDLTARDAADRGFGSVVVDDATADLAQAWHDAALLQIALRWGAVMTCDGVIDALSA